MVNSLGAEGEKAIWGKPADWVDYDGKVADEDVGIAVLDHPKSFRHPTTWHARGYGLFAANPFGLRDFTHDPNQDGSWTIPEAQVADLPLPRDHSSRRLPGSAISPRRTRSTRPNRKSHYGWPCLSRHMPSSL